MDTSGGLVVDGERIADAGLLAAARKEGSLSLYSGYIENSEKHTVRYHGGEFYRVFDPLYTFAYNTVLVDKQDAPTSWKDLTEPKWKGDLGITQVGAGGSSLALTRFQEDRLGPSYLPALADQQPRIFDSSSAALESLARGEISVATAVVSSVNIAASKNAPVDFVVPDEGMAAYDCYLGKATSAKHEAAAEDQRRWLSLFGYL